MITRRNLLGLLGLLGFTKVSLTQTSDNLKQNNKKQELPPHFEAISLVWESQKEQIKNSELNHARKMQSKAKGFVNVEERWWFDAEGRSWDVSRPFEPGGIDSTHLFTVKYLIAGKVVMNWDVDTEKRTVAIRKI